MEELVLTPQDAINAIKSNRPTSGYTVLCAALDMAVNLQQAQQDGRVVMLPCKVGDTAYFILPEVYPEQALVVSEPHKITECGTRGFWTSSLPYDNPDSMSDFEPWESIGKTVFLTRAEAEAALKSANTTQII